VEFGRQPPKFHDGNWYDDEAFLEASTPKEGRKYRPLVCGGLWLPGDFTFSFDSRDLTGEKIHQWMMLEDGNS